MATKALEKAITKVCEPVKKTISIEGITPKVEISEDVDLRLIDQVIDTIVDQVVAQEFKYSLIDIMESYFIMALFTNIPIPILENTNEDTDATDIAAEAERTETSEDVASKEKPGTEYIPDYQRCYIIATKLNLKEQLAEASPVIADMIYLIEKNIWRKLEYKKSLTALIPYESMLDVMSEMYSLLDDLNQYIEKYADVDIDNIATRISDVSKQLSIVKDLKQGEEANKTS